MSQDMVSIARRVRNASHELAIALNEAEEAGAPKGLLKRLQTAALKSAAVATRFAALSNEVSS